MRGAYARAPARRPYSHHLKTRKPAAKVAPMESSPAPSLPPEQESAAAEPTATQLTVAAEPEPAQPSGLGGAREGSGRKKMAKKRKRGQPAFVSLSPVEKKELRRQANAAGLTISYYIRKKLKLPID